MSEERDTAPTRPRFEPPQLWDDAAFRKRLAQLARKKGISVKAAMQEIGLTVEFAYRGADSRPTNLIMVIANYFGISPAELAGWATSANITDPKGPVYEDGLTHKLAELFSQQTLKMLLITLTMAHPDMNPKVIAQLSALAKEDWQAMGEKTIQNGG